MTTLTAASGSSLPIRVGETLSIGLRPAASGSKPSVTTSLTAQQGADVVAKGLTNATAVFGALSSLQYEIQRVGTSPDKATAAALTAKIAAAAKQVDQLVAGAKVGKANLLSGEAGSVSVATGSGLRVNIATQALDATSLGLAGLSVTDGATLRAATGKIAQALGQTQLAVFRLQTADGAVGITPAAGNPASIAYGTVLAGQSAGRSGNTATAAVERALNNQIAANASGYDPYGAATGSTSAPQSIFSLFV